MTIKNNLKFLQAYKAIAKSDVKDKVSDVIQLYTIRKISNFQTARNVLDKLTASNKNTVKAGVRLYEKTVEKYKDAEPLPVKRKRIEEEKIQNLKKEKATLKIQNLLRKTIVFDIVKKESAMDDKVIDITVKPQRVGSIIATDLKSILYKAYFKVIKLLPAKAKFDFYSEVDFNFGNGEQLKKPLTSNSFNTKSSDKWAEHVENQIEKAVQSDETIKLKSLVMKFHFILQPTGGSKGTESREKESILNKKSVNRIINEDNNCFWYALTVAMNQTSKTLKDNRYQKQRERVGKDLCNKCRLPWDNQVSFLDIPLVEETFNCNIYVLDLNHPQILGSKVDVWNTLMYKSTNRNTKQYWLLFDENHYHTINNIKAFLAVKHFCCKCFQCFEHKETFTNHECSLDREKKTKKRSNDPRTNKELAHYLKSKHCKGSQEELQEKLANIKDKNYKAVLTQNHNRPRIITFDAETDTHTLTHIPNHIDSDTLEIDEGLTHDYEKCLVKSKAFTGYGCDDEFCNWLFNRDNADTTVMAHNGSGYDFKFVLKWCVKRGLTPDTYIRQGTHIMYMQFRKFNLKFVDTLNFFSEPLRKLPKTYDIDTIKGHFPHHFNTPENQDYIGCIPCEDMFGVKDMDPDDYVKVEYGKGSCNMNIKGFLPWYKQQSDLNNWSFKDEMVKYCRADVELLSKAVLKFRKMFIESLDVDPFRYVTLPSLCLSIFHHKFLPEKTIVGNSSDKDSIVGREWLIYLNNKDLIPEFPIKVDRAKLDQTVDLNKDKIGSKIHHKGKHTFTVDAFDKKNKVIKEFYGCYHHGCRKCHPELVPKYDSTMERRNILEAAGYKVETIWECDWYNIKKGLENKKDIERLAREQNINIRDALFGGRTEAFKSYFKCNKNQKIYYFDVVSLYPTVNSLDQYAVGFKRPFNIENKRNQDRLISLIKSGEFCGVAKVDITPPKDLYVPVLPDNSNGKLLFHLNPVIGKTYASVELKRALEKGYIINKIYGAYEYRKFDGLMKKYVGFFMKIKIENTQVYTQEECDEINKSHKELGFDFEIKPEDTKKNPGLRQLAKLCLNSLWGKFGQRTTLNNYNFYYDYNKLLLKLNDATVKNKKWHIVNKNCVEMRYENDDNITIEAEFIAEIVAAFTTANARMRLYDMLDWLHPSQICYCDTDSVMFIYDETNPEHKAPVNHESNPKTVKFGNGLGEWEDEFKGGWITELVIAGAKSYSYITNTGKTVIKQKGITLDRANSTVVTFETMKDMVLKNGKIKCEERFQFRWDNNSKDVTTVFIPRTIKPTISEKRTVDGYDTLPFGWENG